MGRPKRLGSEKLEKLELWIPPSLKSRAGDLAEVETAGNISEIARRALRAYIDRAIVEHRLEAKFVED